MQVGYKTSIDFLNDMMGGRLDLGWPIRCSALSRIREGKITPLAISTGKRISLCRTSRLQEAGIADIDMNLWWVTAAPAGTPQPIVDKLNGWFTEIGKMDETRNSLPRTAPSRLPRRPPKPRR